MSEHELKVWPNYFDAVESGAKQFEIRKDDRGFAVGDVLRLREYEPGPDSYTGRETVRHVTYLISGDDPMGYAFGLRPGFVAMGIAAAIRARGETT